MERVPPPQSVRSARRVAAFVVATALLATALVAGQTAVEAVDPPAASAQDGGPSAKPPLRFDDPDEVLLNDRELPAAWLGITDEDSWYLSETNAGLAVDQYGVNDPGFDDGRMFNSTLLNDSEDWGGTASDPVGTVVDSAVGYLSSDTTTDAVVIRERSNADGTGSVYTATWYGPQSGGLPAKQTLTFGAPGATASSTIIPGGRPVGVEIIRQQLANPSVVFVTEQTMTIYEIDDEGELAPTNRVLDFSSDAGRSFLAVEHEPSWMTRPLVSGYLDFRLPDDQDRVFALGVAEPDGGASLYRYDISMGIPFTRAGLSLDGADTVDQMDLRYHRYDHDGVVRMAYAVRWTGERNGNQFGRTTTAIVDDVNGNPSPGDGTGPARSEFCPDPDAAFGATFRHDLDTEVVGQPGVEFEIGSSVPVLACATVGQGLGQRTLELQSYVPGISGDAGPKVTEVVVDGLTASEKLVAPEIDVLNTCQESRRVLDLSGQNPTGVDCPVAVMTNVGVAPTASGSTRADAAGARIVTASLLVPEYVDPNIPNRPTDAWRVDAPNRAWNVEFPTDAPGGLVMERLPGTARMVVDLDPLYDGCTKAQPTATCNPPLIEGTPLPTAVLAAPPTVAGSGQKGDGSWTEFTQSSAQGSSSTDITGGRVGFYVEVGAGAEIEDPLGFSEVEVKAQLAASFESEVESQNASFSEVTTSEAYQSNADDDLVVYTTTRSHEYTGTVVESSTGVAIGEPTTFTTPRDTTFEAKEWGILSEELGTSLDYATQDVLGDLEESLGHTVGNPGTYPGSTAEVDEYCMGNIAGTEQISGSWLDLAEGVPIAMHEDVPRPNPTDAILLGAPHTVYAGSGVSESSTIEVEEGTENSWLKEYNVDFEVGASISAKGGFVASAVSEYNFGVTGGFTTGNGASVTLSDGAGFTGSVSNIPDPSLTGEGYEWRMFLCKREISGAPIWFVNYLVTDYQGLGGQTLDPVSLTSPIQSNEASRTPTFNWTQPKGTTKAYDIELEAVGRNDHRVLTDAVTYPDLATALARPESVNRTWPAQELSGEPDPLKEPLLDDQLYRWRVTAKDFFDNTVTTDWAFFVTPPGPVADLVVDTAAPGYALVGETVTLLNLGNPAGSTFTDAFTADGAEITDADPDTEGVQWTPAAAGSVRIGLTSSDGDGRSNTDAQTLLVSPSSADDSYTATEDTTLVVPSATGVLANDSGADTASLVTDVGSGVLSLSGNGAFTWTPPADECGDDAATSFTYRPSGGGIPSGIVRTVSLALSCVDDPPVAVATTFRATEDTPLAVPEPGVLGGADDVDLDEPSETIAAAPASDPGHGSVELAPSGAFTYVPDADFCGTDAFAIKPVTQGADTSVTGAPVAVTVEVECTNDAPTAAASSMELDENGTGLASVTGTDPDGDPLTFSATSGPSHGDLALGPSGSVLYVPRREYCGSDSFGFVASDGTVQSEPAVVTIDVKCAPNAAPFGRMLFVAVTDRRNLGLFGYAIDPDAAGAIKVRVAIQGVGSYVVPTGFVWNDQTKWVGPGYGNDDGFVFRKANLPSGTRDVCTYALDSDGGPEVKLGCHRIVVK